MIRLSKKNKDQRTASASMDNWILDIYKLLKEEFIQLNSKNDL